MKPYTATKSRNAGRESWSVIFRHPARLDVATGKPGRRVRRGLADPETERFPSTSTAKTTVADTELIIGKRVYRALFQQLRAAVRAQSEVGRNPLHACSDPTGAG